MLEEEVADGQSNGRFDTADCTPYVGRARAIAPLPLSPPPVKPATTMTYAEDRRGTNAARAAAKNTALRKLSPCPRPLLQLRGEIRVGSCVPPST